MPAGKGAQLVAEAELPVEEEKTEVPLDFSGKVEYPLVPSDSVINSSIQEPNIYLRYLELAVRFDVRYAQFLSYLPKPAS